MIKIYKVLFFVVTLLLVSGCSSSDEPLNQFDAELYSGKPIDTLSNDEPPLTEKEAITRGDIALRNQNIDLALYEYIRSLSYPEKEYHDKTLYTIGQIHLARQNYRLADKSFLAVIQVNPNHTGALEQLGSLYTKQSRIEEGRGYFYKAVNADQVRLKSSNTIRDQHSVTPADVSDLVVDKSSPILAYNGVGVLADVQGQHLVAQAFFEKALQIDSRSVKGLLNMGYSKYRMGKYDDASYYTRSALEIEPNNEKAQNNLALIHLARGEVQSAINVFMRHMDAPEALNNVGYFLILQGKSDEAIPYLQQAINKKPSYYKLANENLARALAEVREMKGVP